MASVRSSVLTGLAIGGLLILYLFPLWDNRFLPLLDEGAHLSHIFIWRHIDDGWAGLSEYYKLSIDLVPYMVHYGLSYCLALFLGVETGHKIVLSLSMLGVPLAGLGWCARTGRSPWLVVLLLPGAYGFTWGFGYHAFQIGVSVGLLGLVAIDAFIEHPTLRRGLLAGGLGVLTFLSHPVAVGLFVVAAFLLTLLQTPRLKTWGLLAVAGTPTFALCLYQVYRPKEAWLGTHGSAIWEPSQFAFFDKLQYSLTESINPVTGTEDAIAMGAVFFVFCVLAVRGFGRSFQGFLVARRAENPPRIRLRELFRRHRALGMAVALIILFLVLPAHIDRPVYIWIVAGRVLPFLVFFLFLSLPLEALGRERWLYLPAVVAVIALPLIVDGKYRDFNRRMEPFVAMVEQTRGKGEVVTLVYPPRTDPVVNKLIYRQTSAFVQLLRGGYSPIRWVHPNPFPFRHIKQLPQPHDLSPEQFNEAVHGAPYDFILVRNEPSSVVGPGNPRWRIAADHPPWRLYERVAPAGRPSQEPEDPSTPSETAETSLTGVLDADVLDADVPEAEREPATEPRAVDVATTLGSSVRALGIAMEENEPARPEPPPAPPAPAGTEAAP
ncbi:MAG: hypothetical protein AAGF12_40910 [Myxococcota bacterium]